MVGGYYRGSDRRVPDENAARGPVWTAALLATAVAVIVAGWVAAGSGLGARAGDALPALWAAALAMAAVGAISGLLYGDATGDARATRTGSALLLAAAALGAEASGGLEPVALGLSVGAAIWLASGLLGPDVDARRTISHELAAVLVVVGLPVGSVGALASVLNLELGAWGYVLGASAWVLTAVVAASHRSPSPVVAWSVLTAVGWGAWSLAAAVGGLAGSWELAGQIVRTWGLSVSALGAALALTRAARLGRRRLHDVELRRREDRDAILERLREERHELRNALLTVEGASLTLTRFQGSLGEEVEAELRQAVDQGFARLRHLLSAPAERIADGAGTDLVEILARVRLLWSELGVAVRIHAESDEPLLLDVEAETVGCVVDNLLRNAERHGGADLDHPVDVRVQRDGALAVIRVHDHGPGIPSEIGSWVFDRGATTRPADGQGLGLAIARRAARAAGGDLLLEHTEEGASFRVTLPLVGGGQQPPGVVRDEPDERVDVG